VHCLCKMMGMRKLLWTVWFLPVALAAAESPPGWEALADPAKALSKAEKPAAVAGFLLEAGEDAAVQNFIASLPDSKADLVNKLRSQTAFYDGDFPGALQSLELVSTPDPWTVEQKKRIQDLVSRLTKETRSDRVSVRTPVEDAFLASIALPALERTAGEAEAFYGVALSSPVRVEIYPDAESFVKAASLPSDAVDRTGPSAVRFRCVHLLSPAAKAEGYRWLDEAAGGIHRLAVRKLSGGLAPAWIEEGFARRGEDGWRREGDFVPAPSDFDRLGRAALVNPSTGTQLIGLVGLEPGLKNLRRYEDVLLARAEAADAVGFILKDYGKEKLLALLQAFRRMPREDAFVQIFGFSEEAMESAWIETLAGRTWTASQGALDRGAPVQGAAPSGPEARPFLRQGDALRDKRQWSGALVQYRKALAAETDNGAILVRAARAARETDDMAASEEFLKRAVEKNPFYVPAFAAYGRILYDDGRYDDASRILQEGLEVQPFNPRLHETLALISMDLGNIPAARRSLELALRFDPQSADLRDLMRHLPKGRAR